MDEITQEQLKEYYDDDGGYDEIEDQINADLSESLKPRGPDVLYDCIAALKLPKGASAVDVGCAEGKHVFELARRFGFNVIGIDPVASYIERSNAWKQEKDNEQVNNHVSFSEGSAAKIDLPDQSMDLVWCRDVLVHVADLKAAFAEFYRVLKPGGYALTYQTFGTDKLEPAEAEWLWKTMLVIPASAKIENVELAQQSVGFKVVQSIDLGSEWAEYEEENSDKISRNLIQAGRLQRNKAQMIGRYGEANYNIKFGDALWQVYKMIGKTTGHIFVLQKPE